MQFDKVPLAEEPSSAGAAAGASGGAAAGTGTGPAAAASSDRGTGVHRLSCKVDKDAKKRNSFLVRSLHVLVVCFALSLQR